MIQARNVKIHLSEACAGQDDKNRSPRTDFEIDGPHLIVLVYQSPQHGIFFWEETFLGILNTSLSRNTVLLLLYLLINTPIPSIPRRLNLRKQRTYLKNTQLVLEGPIALFLCVCQSVLVECSTGCIAALPTVQRTRKSKLTNNNSNSSAVVELNENVH